jgi:aspartate aminotransferase-like enzyme
MPLTQQNKQRGFQMTEEKHLIMLPGPTNVPDNVMQAMLKPIINHRGPEFEALFDSITHNLKYVFQTKQDAFVLTSSGTGAVECAISNITNPNDKIIVPVFGVFSQRLKEKIERHGGKPVEIPINWGDAPTAQQIEKTIKKEKTAKAVAIVYNETSTGATVRNLPQIGEVTKENNILLIVDAISILGGDHLPVDKWNIDICAAGSQKCLACPPGLAIISVSQNAWKTIEKITSKPYYFDLLAIREFASKKATPFTPALPLFYALDEALKTIKRETLENRFKRHQTCAKAFYAAAQALNLKPYPTPEARSNTVIALNVPKGIDNAKVRQTMKTRYKVEIAGGMDKIKDQILRIGCMGTISEKETLTTINALENTLNNQNYKVKIGASVEAAHKVFH